ncbi:unnamed protein product [Meganyctiphanes norvegica]|uniref:C2H2-type domain-containing protein n=1 Tax=Meganyctiphanes norvegica TaxID=48144 RepID=A0AAV2RL72_MEGNR
MNDIGSEGEDEFECSECEFKCSNEIDIIEHSEIHQSANNAIDNILDVPSGSTFRHDSVKENLTDVNQHKNVNNDKEKEANIIMPLMPELDDFLNYKSREIKDEEHSTNEVYQKIIIGNKKIKLEDIDIKEEDISHPSTHQINEYDNIPKTQNTLIEGLALMISETEYVDGREAIYSAHYNKVNIFKKEKTFTEKEFGNVSTLLSCKNNPLRNDLGFRISIEELSFTEIPFHVEVEVDQTGLYIPPGWKLKVNMGNRICSGQIMYECFYYTGLGTKLSSKKDANDYLIKNSFANFDTKRLHFSVRLKSKNPVQPTIERGADNGGVYVPDGWQRKVCVSTIAKAKRQHHINYINPIGKSFWSKSAVYAYLSHPDSFNEKFIDVEKMNFSFIDQSCFNLYMCKLCCYSFRDKSGAYNHDCKNIQKCDIKLTSGGVLPKYYKYFVCTDCCMKLMRHDELPIHLRYHINKNTSSTEVMSDSNRKMIVYGCEKCNFGCLKYLKVLEHLKNHAPHIITPADEDAYPRYANEIDENTLKCIYKIKAN